MILRIALFVLTALLMAAHFLRAGDYLLVALCLAAPLLFFLRTRWSLMVLQGLSFAAALVWLATAWQIAEMRQMFGQPWLRSALILGSVAAFSAVAGLLLNGLRGRYPAGK